MVEKVFKDMQATTQPSSRRTLATDEIRLLIYDEEQSQRSGLLACRTRIERLSHVNTGVAIPYAALSYVWGDAAITKPMICDGVEVLITVNLHHALSAIWNKYPEICLWADALSITQDNLAERNHQVSLMGNIFRSAIRVFVSLGPPLNGNDWLWSFLQNFADKDLYYTKRAELREWQHEFREAFDNRLARVLDDLFKRPWFHRAWTYQEICLATAAEVFCGDSFMPWNTFVTSKILLGFVRELPTAAMSVCRFNVEVRDLAPHNPKGARAARAASLKYTRLFKVKLLDILVDGWPRDASDARDKIYAFTSSLLSSASYVELRPDYSLDLRNTFIQLIRVLINNENDLEFLEFARGVDDAVQLLDDAVQFPADAIQSSDAHIWDDPEGIPLKVHRLTEGDLSALKDKDDPEEPVEADVLPSWACDWRRRGRRDKVYSGPQLDDYYFNVRENALPLRQSVYDFDKRLVLRGVALARAGYPQTEATTSSRIMLGTFSRLPRCALHKAYSGNTASIPRQYEMFDTDFRSEGKSLTGSNMAVLLLQTLLHDQSVCDCPESLEQDLLKARCLDSAYPRSSVVNLDWLFLLDGFKEPVILRPHITPGQGESTRSEIGFDFVSVLPLDVRLERWYWGQSPFAYGEVVLF